MVAEQYVCLLIAEKVKPAFHKTIALLVAQILMTWPR
jgi:hypothetical protein